MDYYVNPYIKQTERIFPMQGRADYLRYDMNENPEGLPQEIVDKTIAKYLQAYELLTGKPLE